MGEEKLPLGEGSVVGGDGDAGLISGDGESVAESAGLAGDLDALLEKFLQ